MVLWTRCTVIKLRRQNTLKVGLYVRVTKVSFYISKKNTIDLFVVQRHSDISTNSQN